MRTVNVKVPYEASRRARIWVAQRETSVSVVVKFLLETLPSLKRGIGAFPVSTVNPARVVDKSTSN
jgi:hypothetical protein